MLTTTISTTTNTPYAKKQRSSHKINEIESKIEETEQHQGKGAMVRSRTQVLEN